MLSEGPVSITLTRINEDKHTTTKNCRPNGKELLLLRPKNVNLIFTSDIYLQTDDLALSPVLGPVKE